MGNVDQSDDFHLQGYTEDDHKHILTLMNFLTFLNRANSSKLNVPTKIRIVC